MDVARGVWPERRERVDADDPLLVEIVRTLRAEHDGTVLCRAHEEEADAGMGPQRG
jgi:hypothetical protein